MVQVNDEMRALALRELQGELTDDELAALHRAEVENCDAVETPGQVKPTWEQISADLEQLLTPKEEEQNQ